MAVPICVVGGGQIGERHAQVAMASDLVDLTAVVEPVSERRAALRDLGYRAVASLDEIPNHTRGAIIATPTADHPDSVKPLIDRGIAVIVEKPPQARCATAMI